MEMGVGLVMGMMIVMIVSRDWLVLIAMAKMEACCSIDEGSTDDISSVRESSLPGATEIS